MSVPCNVELITTLGFFFLSISFFLTSVTFELLPSNFISEFLLGISVGSAAILREAFFGELSMSSSVSIGMSSESV